MVCEFLLPIAPAHAVIGSVSHIITSIRTPRRQEQAPPLGSMWQVGMAPICGAGDHEQSSMHR